MPIREEAAKRLAQDILEPFMKMKLCNGLSVDLVASLIKVTVANDEAEVAIEHINSGLETPAMAREAQS